jgi:hypothetical protein
MDLTVDEDASAAAAAASGQSPKPFAAGATFADFSLSAIGSDAPASPRGAVSKPALSAAAAAVAAARAAAGVPLLSIAAASSAAEAPSAESKLQQDSSAAAGAPSSAPSAAPAAAKRPLEIKLPGPSIVTEALARRTAALVLLRAGARFAAPSRHSAATAASSASAAGPTVRGIGSGQHSAGASSLLLPEADAAAAADALQAVFTGGRSEAETKAAAASLAAEFSGAAAEAQAEAVAAFLRAHAGSDSAVAGSGAASSEAKPTAGDSKREAKSSSGSPSSSASSAPANSGVCDLTDRLLTHLRKLVRVSSSFVDSSCIFSIVTESLRLCQRGRVDPDRAFCSYCAAVFDRVSARARFRAVRCCCCSNWPRTCLVFRVWPSLSVLPLLRLFIACVARLLPFLRGAALAFADASVCGAACSISVCVALVD